MITQSRRFLYQPDPLRTVIIWSWTLLILLVGIIVWLEITHFQWMTFGIFMLFALVVWSEIHFRSITTRNGLLTVSRLINHHYIVTPLKDITEVNATRWRLSFVANGKPVQFILPSNSVIELRDIIEIATK